MKFWKDVQIPHFVLLCSVHVAPHSDPLDSMVRELMIFSGMEIRPLQNILGKTFWALILLFVHTALTVYIVYILHEC